MHINGILTSLLSFLLPIQFIVVQRYPFGLALLSYMCPNKGMLKGAQRNTSTPNMKACTCIQGTPHFPPERNKEFYDMG